uniref:FAM69 N-terminal domain-containing protein n=1 Tax=Knipowitschia caucasica TaxID=637954 RepID=A0AAV2L802_KNICA
MRDSAPADVRLELWSRGRSQLRWLTTRLFSRGRWLLLLLLWFGSWLVLNGLVLVHRHISTDVCSDKHGPEILTQLCQDFSSGLVSGELCVDLCVLHTLQYHRCLYYENGKKVLEARWRGQPVILKSKHENFTSYEPLSALQDPNASEDLSPLDVVYYATMEVRSSLGLLEEDGERLQNGSVWAEWQQRADPNRTYTRAELSSLWALLQQEEYTFFRLLQDLTPHVARVLSSCGHFYAVEFLSAGHAWDQNLFSLADPPQPVLPLAHGRGGRDHRIALSFLDLVWHFDHDFHHKLHMCDVKPENFGIREDLTVVALDVDMVFFEPKLQELLEQNCSSDDDCCFFDCWSQCDTHTLRCAPNRSNSNLQAICEKIFRPWFSPSLLGPKAALPLQVELQRAVQECSEIHLDHRPEHRPDHRPDLVHKRLVHALTRLVEAQL